MSAAARRRIAGCTEEALGGRLEARQSTAKPAAQELDVTAH